MTRDVYLICGVSGSGKTWICNQLKDKFTYVAHDEHFNDHELFVWKSSKDTDKPILTECPFAERILKEKLEGYGLKVIPYFVIEHPRVCEKRYMDREGKPIQKAAYTRAATIINRAIEWKAPNGTSEEVLKMLQGLKV